jgi:hypothetical protein
LYCRRSDIRVCGNESVVKVPAVEQEGDEEARVAVEGAVTTGGEIRAVVAVLKGGIKVVEGVVGIEMG